MEHFYLWTQFFALSVLIFYAGYKLVSYAEVISDRSGLGHIFIGMVFLGWVTSLPEAVLSLGSVISVGSPDLAIGNITGSCLFNIGILAAMDFIILKGALFELVTRGTLQVTRFSLIMMSLVALQLVAGVGGILPSIVATPFGLRIDLISYLIILGWFLCVYLLYKADRQIVVRTTRRGSLPWTVLAKAGIAASVIIIAGICLPGIGDRMAVKYNLGHSFVGALFFAVVSSLPELSTTIAALKSNKWDMAVGNIFGSNIFNIMIIALADIFFRQSGIFTSNMTNQPAHLSVAVCGIMATAAFLLGIRFAVRKVPSIRLNIVSLIVLLIYITGLVLSYIL